MQLVCVFYFRYLYSNKSRLLLYDWLFPHTRSQFLRITYYVTNYNSERQLVQANHYAGGGIPRKRVGNINLRCTMAGSRLEKVGTVFTRVRDLMRAGVIKECKKPVWFDVYAAFPPKREPVYVKPVRKVRQKTEENVPEIFYKEDGIRAKFYELYGNGPKAFELTKTSFVSTCQRFVEKYSELESRGDVKPEILLEETAKALLADGVVLRRRGGPAVAAETRNPVLHMKLTDMLAEQQKDTVNAIHTPEENTRTIPTDSSHT